MSIEQKTCLDDFLSIPYERGTQSPSPESKSIEDATRGIENFTLTVANQGWTDYIESNSNIKIEGFSISIGKRCLFNNAILRLTHGRRYGLVGYLEFFFFKFLIISLFFKIDQMVWVKQLY